MTRTPTLAMALLALVALTRCGTAESHESSDPSTGIAADTTQPSVVIGRDEADRLWVFAESKDELGSGGEFHIYVDPETHPEARASFAEFGLGVGGALPVHRHDRTKEISYFLSGEGVFTVYRDGKLEDVAVEAGTVVYTPPGSWHAIRNTGEAPLKLVFAAIPNEEKGLLSFFRKIGAAPGQEPTPLSPDEFARIAAEHDLVLRAPGTE